MRILVTGASGFIGGTLIALLLERKHSVRALLRTSSSTQALPDEKYVERAFADLDPARDDNAALARALDDIDAVIHCGGTTRKVQTSEAELFRVNRDGSALLADLCMQSSARPRLVLASTLSAVGPSSDESPIRESAKPNPRSSYGRSKLAAEAELRKRSGLAFSIVRLPAVIGPRDINLVPLFKLARRGIRLSGPQIANFLHVRDACEFLLRAAVEPSASGQTLHAAGTNLTRAELGKLIAGARRTIPLRLPYPALYAAALLAEQWARVSGRPARLDREKATELLESWPLDPGFARERLRYESLEAVDQDLMREIEESYENAGWLQKA